MKNFVNYKWLEERLYSNNLVILDARGDLKDFDKGIELYNQGHIPNSHYVSMEEVLTGKLSEHGGRHPLPEIDKFVEDMKELGISDESTIVIYDDGKLSFAGRLWWLLKYIGKENIYVLEGGYNDWVRSGGEISESSPLVEKSDSLSVNINDDMKVGMEYVRDSLYKDDTAIVDSRAHERYIGKVEPLDKKAGRIPSALNYPYEELLEKNDEFPTLEILKEYYKDLKKYDEIIVYCGSGISATVNLLFMDEVGLEPKIYPGSFSDWISYDENKIETDY